MVLRRIGVDNTVKIVKTKWRHVCLQIKLFRDCCLYSVFVKHINSHRQAYQAYSPRPRLLSVFYILLVATLYRQHQVRIHCPGHWHLSMTMTSEIEENMSNCPSCSFLQLSIKDLTEMVEAKPRMLKNNESWKTCRRAVRLYRKLILHTNKHNWKYAFSPHHYLNVWSSIALNW